MSLAGNQELPTLPEEAIVRYKGKNYIFFQEGATSFKMAEVETGVTEEGIIEVHLVKQLPEGAQVVTKDAYYVLAEKMKSEIAEK